MCDSVALTYIYCCCFRRLSVIPSIIIVTGLEMSCDILLPVISRNKKYNAKQQKGREMSDTSPVAVILPF